MPEKNELRESELKEIIVDKVASALEEEQKKTQETLAKLTEDYNSKIEKALSEVRNTIEKTRDPNYGQKLWVKLVHAACKGGGNLDYSEKVAKAMYDREKNHVTAGLLDFFEKSRTYQKGDGSLNLSHPEEGGILINVETSPEIYAIVSPNPVTDKIPGLNKIMLSGELKVLAEKTLPTVNVTHETGTVNASYGTFEMTRLDMKKLMALWPITNDAIYEGNMGEIQLASNMLVRSFNETKEYDFIRGSGVSDHIFGLKTLAQYNTAASATMTAAQFASDFRKYLLGYMAKADGINMGNVVFIASELDKLRFDTYVDATYGTRPFFLGDNTIFYRPLIGTNHIPTNLTVATVTNTSELYAVDGSNLVYAQSPTYRLEVLRDVNYLDASGTAVAGASKDMSAIRIVGKHGLLKLRAAAVQMLSKTTYSK